MGAMTSVEQTIKELLVLWDQVFCLHHFAAFIPQLLPNRRSKMYNSNPRKRRRIQIRRQDPINSNNNAAANDQSTSSAAPSTSSTTASASMTATSQPPPNIPGMYYDPERRKYFRILPEHSAGGLSGFVTNQSIKQNEQELHRQGLVRDLNNPSTATSGNSTTMKTSSNHSIPSILRRSELGILTGPMRIQRAIIESRTRFSVLTPIRIKNVEQVTSGYHKLFPDHLVSSDSGRSILGVGANNPSMASPRGIFQLDLTSNAKENGETMELFGEFEWLHREMSHSTVTDFSATSSGYLVVPFALLRRGFQSPFGNSRVTVCPPQTNETSTDQPNGNFHMFVNAFVQTGDYASSTNRLVIGTDRWIAFNPIDNVEAQTYVFKKAFTLITRFSKDEDLLFTGFRNKPILVTDLRAPAEPVGWLEQKNVSSIYTMRRDTSYIVASDFTGEIKLWDLRMQKSVLSFAGHVNTHTKLSLIVDEEDSLVISGGEDGTTRVWSLHDAQLLRRIPSPRPVTDSKSIPLVCYSNRWLGIPGNAGVILGVQDELLLYRFK